MRGTIADVAPDLSAIAARVECSDHAAAIRPLPPTNVERNSVRGVPRQLLCREAFDSRMGQYARQRSGKTKAIGQHVFRARPAQLAPEKLIDIKNLAKERLSRRQVDIALFHRRASRKPASRSDVLLHARVIGGPVFLHHAIAICAAEVEDVMRILLEEREIVVHRLRNVVVDDARILPTPLRVEVRVSNDVKRGLFTEVRLGLNRTHKNNYQKQ